MATKQDLLDQLKKKMSEDNTLPLKKEATNLVFGEGDPEAEIMCIGEGPGYYEDQKARPFVGNAGAFLNQLLAVAGYERENVYITNVIHYRPPENRDPEANEIAAFKPYLDKMIEIIEPDVILTLGRFSMGKFLPDARISKVHGKNYNVSWQGKDLVVIPMYHPAAGLRNPTVKAETIEDFKNLPKIMEVLEKKENKDQDKGEQMNLI